MTDGKIAGAMLVVIAMLVAICWFGIYSDAEFGRQCVEAGGSYIKGQCIQLDSLCEGRAR